MKRKIRKPARKEVKRLKLMIIRTDIRAGIRATKRVSGKRFG